MSPAGASLRDLIDAARRRVQRDTRIAAAAAAALVIPVALVLAWLLASAADWAAPSPLPLLVEVGGVLGIAGVGFLALRRWLRGTGEEDVAATAEQRLGLAAGSVLGALELGRDVPAGTSPALARHAEAGVAEQFRGRSVGDVSGEVGRRASRRRRTALATLAAGSAVVALLAFASPTRTQNAWVPLLKPITHLSSSSLPALVVEPGDAEVLRGADVTVTIAATGRTAVALVWRAEGDVLRRETVPVVDGSAEATLERIDALTRYWVEAPDGARSDTYRILPRDPLLVSELTLDVRYPAYLGRTPERFETEIPPLELPEGTTLVLGGRATRPLASASLAGSAGELPLTVDGERFAATFVPSRSGSWEWSLRDAAGTTLATAPPPLDITVVPDVPPEVEITYPAQDTVLDPERVHLIAGDGRDDYGIAEAILITWRITAGGRSEPRTEIAVPLSDEGERTLLRTILDLRDRELLPGDTIRYFMRVIDNSPQRQAGESRTWSIYVPGAADLREQVDRETDEAVREVEEMAQAARDLQESMRNLQRRTEASRARRNEGNDPSRTGARNEQGTMEFRESEQGRQVLEQQEQMTAGLEELRERMEALEKLMEAAGLQDQRMRERLDELRALYEELLTPEMKQQVEQLREALEKLDPEQLQRALEELSKQQAQLREQLESSLEQLKQAAMEQRASALAQEARELATQQQALADAMRERARPEQAATQRQLEERARELGRNIDELSRDLSAQKQERAQQDASNAQSQVGAAEQAMRDAAQRAASRQNEQAARAAQEAASNLEQAAGNLDAARQAITDAARRELEEGMQQAMNEALSLAERQQSLLDRLEQMRQEQQGQQQQDQQGQRGQQQGQQQQQGQRGQQQQQGQQAGGQQGGSGGQDMQGMRAEQGALQQGLEQLSRNLSELGQQSGMVSRDVGAALGRANLSMQQTAQAMQDSEAARRMPTQEASQTVEALNRLALALLQNQQQIEQSQDASGMQQAMQQLQDLAQQQGALNGRTSALMPLDLTPRALAQQAERMARDQREIAAQLGDLNQRLGREDALGRVDEMAREAENIARELASGRPPPQVLARQERLFHRLLDAGRTLEKDEESEERVGERPGEYTPSVAPALNPALLDTSTRYRVPTPDELRSLPPTYRKLILDYFERINRRTDRQEREPM